MPLTIDSSKELWESLQRFQTIFSDLRPASLDAFTALLTKPDAFWLEVRELDKCVGIIYIDELSTVIDAEVHAIFFDRKLVEKVELCRAVVGWLFKSFQASNA